MGEASRAKWKRRLERALETAPKMSGDEVGGRPFLKWLRGSGIAAVFVGMVGLMQTLFWPSVFFVYVGMTLIVVDLYCEKLHPGFKLSGFVVMLILAIAFTLKIVLRDDPLSITYARNNNGVVNIYILNTTATDYRDLDLHVQLPRDTFIAEKRKGSDLASCSLINFTDGAALLGESIHQTTATFTNGDSTTTEYPTYQRVRCDTLPHYSQFSLLLQVEKQTQANAPLAPYVGEVEPIKAVGSYRGKFREFDVDRKLSLQSLDRHASGWKDRHR